MSYVTLKSKNVIDALNDAEKDLAEQYKVLEEKFKFYTKRSLFTFKKVQKERDYMALYDVIRDSWDGRNYFNDSEKLNEAKEDLMAMARTADTIHVTADHLKVFRRFYKED